ncbi:MAG TPA: Xaa-Pro peptidase family protein [Chloroflexota bacterium]|nr:Xaa-Pro peptidase family protein [Chloroflexota bacterium]
MDKLAYGVGAVDFQARIDYARLRAERLARAQAALKEAGLAAALLTRTENIRYTTALRGPFFAPQLRYVLLFAEHDPVVYELGDILEGQKRHATWIKPENWRFAYCWLNGIAGPDAIRAEAKRFADAIVRDLKEHGCYGEKLGTDGLDEAGRQALLEAGVQLAPAMPALLKARSIKTPDEVACIRLAIAIANRGYARLCEVLRPGLRERDVGGAVYEAMMQAGAEVVSGGVRSGPNTFEVYHIGNTDRMIEVGDLLYLNTCSTTFNGYRVCIYRSFIVGRRPNARERDWYARCRDRVYAVISEIRPGATTADAAKHFLPASTWGYEAEQRLLVAEVGHGIGMTYEEPVISRVFSFEHPQPFEPGQVIAVEAREGEPGYGGVRLEEMVLVTETGHEILTTWPADQLVQVGHIVD